MRRIMVTGGAGFIGYHLCRSLLKNGMVLCVVDQLHPYYAPATKEARLTELRNYGEFRFERTDILDEARMDELFRREKPDAVIHLAAIPGVRGSLEQPLSYVDVDVKGTVHLLELARKYDVGRFVFASSSSVYGERMLERPLREEDAGLQVSSPYAASKLAAEIFCQNYSSLYGLAVTSLRFFTVFGPHQRPDMAISKFVTRLLNDQPLPLFDRLSIRDYTYVGDIVAGIEAALEKADGYQVYNLGSGEPIGLMSLIDALEQVTGKTAVTIDHGAQPGDVSGTWADISKARQLLGWSPKVKLMEGLLHYYRWCEQR